MPNQDQNREGFERLHNLIAGASHVLLATHERPDADAIGAVYAMAHIGKKLNRPTSIFLPDGVPQELLFLPAVTTHHATAENLPGDVLVAVDYGDFARTKLHEYIEAHPMRIATIDHHPSSDQRGEVQIVDTGASSTCELVYRYCVFANIPLHKELATCLLAGIVFDTGGLQHSSTSPGTLRIVSDLVRHGARMHKVTQVIRPSQEEKNLRIIADALSAIMYDADIGMSYAVVHHKDLLETGGDIDLSLVTHLISTGKEQKFAAFFKEAEPGKFRISLRSENFKGVDVSAIAKQLGGGGHKYASGCQVEGEFLYALLRVREAARAVIR
ncbi:MAG: DHH family phosphoesterase [bacterium]|nr:DHH family phosphoesterase [bacterium]